MWYITCHVTNYAETYDANTHTSHALAKPAAVQRLCLLLCTALEIISKAPKLHVLFTFGALLTGMVTHVSDMNL